MSTQSFKVGIIGSGIVGQTLAKAFIAEGHTVTLGTRDILKPALVSFQSATPGLLLGNFEIW